MAKNWPSPRGEREQKFLELYLNPALSREVIQRRLGVSPATFYRLVEDSGISSCSVGVLTDLNLPSRSPLHWKRFWEKSIPPGISHHIEVALQLSAQLRKRFDLKFLPSRQIAQGLQEGSLHLAVASLTKTMGRHPGVEFSEPYLFRGKPEGAIFVKKEKAAIFAQKKRPILGVTNGSLHQHCVPILFQKRFRVIAYNFRHEERLALEEGRIDALFAHPHYVEDIAASLQMVEGPYAFGGHTGVGVSEHSLLPEVNQALEQLYEAKILQALDQRYRS